MKSLLKKVFKLNIFEKKSDIGGYGERFYRLK
jgi:hypothetical protein